MASQNDPAYLHRQARLAGLLYLGIILCGISAEVLRLGFPWDAVSENTARDLLRLRVSVALDVVMGLCDAGVGVLLFLLFRSLSLPLALGALVFRLIQTAMIGAGLSLLVAVAQFAETSPDLAAGFGEMHRTSYDLALIFFGVSTLLNGRLVILSGWYPRLLGPVLLAAGVVYLAGGAIVLLAPQLSDMFAPVYVIPLLAELFFCLVLLTKGAGKHSPA